MKLAKTGTTKGESLYNKLTEEDFEHSLMNLELEKVSKKRLLYFAGPWFTPKARDLYGFVMNTWDFCKAKVFNDGVFFPATKDFNTPDEVFRNNIEMLNKCTDMLAFISEKDTGTALEIGYFLAKGKSVTLLVYDESDLTSKTNLMLSRAAKVITLKKLERFFAGDLNDDDYIKIENNWEGVE